MRTPMLLARVLLILAWIAWLIAFWQSWLSGGWAVIAIAAIGIAESAYTQISRRFSTQSLDAKSG